MDDNWDLHAIVRSCQFLTSAADGQTPPITPAVEAGGGNPSSEDALSCLASLTFEEENGPFSYPAVQPNGFQELDQVAKTIFATNAAASVAPTVPGGFAIHHSPSFTDFARSVYGQNQPQQGGQCHPPVPLLPTSNPPRPLLIPAAGSNPAVEIYHYPPQPQRNMNPSRFALPNRPLPHSCCRTRRRRFLQKKLVCQVSADDVSTDAWAWRKYGQKPIKGSPFPRNYYRCSSSKGCGARKHVERSTTEPGMYVVTYAGDHTHPLPAHRNSLASINRNTRIAICPNPYPYPVGTGLPVVAPPTVPPKNEARPSGDQISTNDTDWDMDMELASDDDDVLVPNMAAFDNDVFFDVDQLCSDGASTSKHAGGSSPSQPA
ncbi:hypothetical protein L6164_008402 [Bauhinia variegata]|uniref:Uncharacterized protein n=1 Tax=Bauhinia variegata TaxID=167791 RepID=A0ACB9PGN4_BAUVA|nr:hypothetical protein L6164_008402 [Bauhinia variegata]